jgi:bifunctional non-homologous end joining protein LigD
VPRGIEPSHLEKVFWPHEALTKGDLLGYFEAVAPFIVPALHNRPLTVKRYPDGIDGFSFFQKNAPRYTPDWVKTVRLPAWSAGRDVDYILCNSKRTLLWLANQAAIELHPWLSSVDHLHRPTHLVFDLDPPEGRFELAVRAALATREVLEAAGLASAAKTSGAKGMHVYVPLQRRYPYGRVRLMAEELAHRVQEAAPELATTEFRLAKRGGRVFVDVGRVGMGAHTIGPYSPRARPGAAVSFPVAWDEVPSVDPSRFTIRTVPGLLEKHGDLWRALMPALQPLPRG